VLGVERERIEDALRLLRDEHDYQQLMEIAGVDYPSREERFEVVYMLLSLTKNHRVMVKVRAAEDTPVPTVTTLWPVAGWLEREVFDMYGVIFDGNTDLRRILTDYGFEGIRSARTSRSPAIRSCATPRRRSAWSTSRSSWRRTSARSSS
jgi:NADH-quinone oxidoreductase subunit C